LGKGSVADNFLISAGELTPHAFERFVDPGAEFLPWRVGEKIAGESDAMAILSLPYLREVSALTGVFLLSAMAFPGSAVPAGAAASEPDGAITRLSETNRSQRLVANLPLYLIENQGQLDRRPAV